MRAMNNRAIHLIDLENLTGSPWASALDVDRVLADYAARVPCSPADLAVIASNANNGRMALAAPEAWRHHTGSGCCQKVAHRTDGADLALLDACDAAWAARHASTMVIGSGDHIFAPLATQLRDLGVRVIVASRPRSLAHTLRVACDQVIHLHDPSPVVLTTPRAA